MDLIRDQGFREQRGEYGSRMGGGEGLDVSREIGELVRLCFQLQYNFWYFFSFIIFFFFTINLFCFPPGPCATLRSWNCDRQEWRND